MQAEPLHCLVHGLLLAKAADVDGTCKFGEPRSEVTESLAAEPDPDLELPALPLIQNDLVLDLLAIFRAMQFVITEPLRGLPHVAKLRETIGAIPLGGITSMSRPEK